MRLAFLELLQAADQTSSKSAKTKVSKRGSGGAWRAFVHCHTTQEKWGADTLSQLGERYRNLTQEEKEPYRVMGKSATMNRHLGVASFPVWSSRAGRSRFGHCKEDRDVEDSHVLKFAEQIYQLPSVGALAQASSDDDVLEAVRSKLADDDAIFSQLTRAVARCFRQVAQAGRPNQTHLEVLKELAPQSQRAAEQILAERQHLLTLETCTWHSFPGPCATLLASFEPENVLSGASSINNLADAWQRRHLGIEQNSWKHGEAKPPRGRTRICLANSFCICRGRGKLVSHIRGKLMRHFRQLCHEKHVEELLLSGSVLLQFLSHIPEPKPNDDMPSEKRQRTQSGAASSSAGGGHVGDGAAGETLFYLVALMYLKPWRPTCVFFRERTQANYHDMLSVVLEKTSAGGVEQFEPAPGRGLWREGPKPFVCAQSLGGGPECLTIWEVLNRLNLEHDWWVKPWILSTSQAVVPNISNCVFAEPSSLPPARIWDCKMVRERRRRARARPIHDVIDMPNVEDRAEEPPQSEERERLESASEEENSDQEDEFEIGREELLHAMVEATGVDPEALEEEVEQNPQAAPVPLPSSSSSSDSSSDTSSSSSGSSSSDDNATRGQSNEASASTAPAPCDAPVEIHRVPGGERLARDALQVRSSENGPIVGFLKHAPGQSSLYAVCVRHRNCVKTRTYKKSSRIGAGRPVGFLSGWLHVSNDHDSKASHMKAMPSFATRLAARELIQMEWNSSDFLELERGLEEGEGLEPVEVHT